MTSSSFFSGLPGFLGSGFAATDLTFERLYHLRLGNLETAVERRRHVRDKFETMALDAERRMRDNALRADWRGENADASKTFIQLTARKFRFAYDQATAFHDILASLLAALRDGKEALRRCEAEARDWRLHIDPDGTIRSAEPPYLSRSDTLLNMQAVVPGGPDPLSEDTIAAMDAMEQRVNALLDAVTEADRIAAQAIHDILNRQPGHAFSQPQYLSFGAAKTAQAEDDAALFVRLARKDHLMISDLRQMDALMGEWGDDPAFGQHVIDTMGMEAYLALAQRVEADPTLLDLSSITADDFHRGMGNTLAMAMRPPGDMSTHPPGSPAFQAWLTTAEGQRYQARLNAFHAAGLQRPGAVETPFGPSGGLSRLGYDLALDVLEDANVPMDDHFYNQFLSRMVDEERENPMIWTGDRYPPADPRNDAVDRLLGIGAYNNPAAVTAFFDPAAHDPNKDEMSNLRYFLGQGEGTRSVQLMLTDVFDNSDDPIGIAPEPPTQSPGPGCGPGSRRHRPASLDRHPWPGIRRPLPGQCPNRKGDLERLR